MKRLLALALALCATGAMAQQPPAGWVNASPATFTQAMGTVPASIAGSGSWTSDCVVADFYRAFSAFGALAAAGTMQVQRYADRTCTLPAGAAVPSTALALATGTLCPATSRCGTVASNDGAPFMALKVMLIDTSTATNAIVGTTLLLGSE